ncbi:Mov34/MPN/PAD-1 family protein [Candidatus Woesearchaeota archaeon]|nr:Mov34/MPN/PAD-1 family protein [Candidatus Woesearchaeota archaeon]
MERLFELDKFVFEKVIIEQEVIDAIVELAEQTYPKEFIAFLEGKVKNKVLRIYRLNYQEYIANPSYTVYKMDFPITSDIVGTVHSHPGPSNRPSKADLQSFSKKGIVHLIISMPYSSSTIQAYDMNGNMIDYEVA